NDSDSKQDAKDQAAGRQFAFARRGNLNDAFPPVAAAGNLGLEPLNKECTVKAKVIGIGPDETNRIGASRQRIEIAFLDGVEAILAVFKTWGGGGMFFGRGLRGGAKFWAARLKRRMRVVENFVQLKATAVRPATAVQR